MGVSREEVQNINKRNASVQNRSEPSDRAQKAINKKAAVKCERKVQKDNSSIMQKSRNES